MKVKQLSLLLLLIAAFFSSCKKETNDPAGKYERGVFVVNEGMFGGTGTITWHDPVSGETEQDIFSANNDGAVLGELPQSLTFYKDKGYICIGNGTKIVVVDAATFKFLGTIEGLAKPRYMMPYNDSLALVTQWGADGNTGTVAQLNLNTNKVVRTSDYIGAGPDKMFRLSDDVVLIPNAGGFLSDDSTIVTFRLSSFSVENRSVAGGKNPSVCARSGSQIFVLCKGSYSDPAPTGWLGLVADPAMGQNIPLYSDDLCASPDQSTLYFTGGSAIYALKNNVLSTFVQQNAYGLACDPTTGELYCTDAKNFNTPGEAVVYLPNGVKVGMFATGIGPGEIVVVE